MRYEWVTLSWAEVSAEGGGRERERELELVVLGVTCGHTEPCPLWVRDIDIWKRWGGERIVKEKKAYFFQLSCLTNCLASAHSAQRQQPLNLPTTWICMISPLFFSALWAVFFFHPETCRVVFDWPWHLKRSLNKEKKKSCLWQLENSPCSGEKKWHFERSTAPAYLNANGSVNVQANRMFQSGVVQYVHFEHAARCLSASS